MTQVITGAAFKSMVINAAAVIEQNKQQINDLNVFPVPDGDTGTNMSLTIGAGATELKKSEPTTLTAAVDITAAALLRGARGNSGVILSLLFRGMAKALKGLETAGTGEFAIALSDGVAAAYKAVMKPTEGTILTVSRLASEAAVSLALEEDDMEVFLQKIIAVAEKALTETVNQNPVLKKAGVVDAGGKGYICMLTGMLKALRGEMIAVSDAAAGKTAENGVFSAFETEDIQFAYCTEFIVSRENLKSPEVLRDFLGDIGDSLVLVDDDDIIKVHVHTNDPGVVLTQALAYGSLITVKVENMREQHTEQIRTEHQQSAEKDEDFIASPEKKYGVVAVCAGVGMAEVFRDLGVDGIITGGQTMNPSTEDILKEINKTPAEVVFVLPNNKNIIMAAQQCQPLTEKKVVVIPSKTVPQGISALLNLDASLPEEEITASLTSALSNIHTVQITYAARDSEFDGHTIRAGEYLALLESALLANESEFSVLMNSVTEALSNFSPEFITIFYGEDVSEEAADQALSAMKEAFPDTEVTLVSGGQPVYYYMISAE